jgi:hypothetical protein
MGGNAFSDANRISKEVYQRLVTLAESINTVRVPHSVLEKEDYGDIDLISYDKTVVDKLRSVFTIISEIKNTGGYNFLIEFENNRYQMDLSFHDISYFDFAFNYFSWNDLGNLIGRIAHRQGLKFGHDGLWYIHRNGSEVLGEILIEDSFLKAIRYLGFDISRYLEGFNSFEDMFYYVTESENFDPNAFPLEFRNHKARTRDAKRKTYNAFLKFLNYTGSYVESDKDAWLVKHCESYPKLKAEIDRLDVEKEKRVICKSKLNGKIVKEMFPFLDGKELGVVMGKLNSVFTTEYLLRSDVETVKAEIFAKVSNILNT